MILTLLLFLLLIPFASAENVTIDSSMSIQDTVDIVNDSDTIYLTPGTYNESGIKIDKNITLQGLGQADEIIIDGENKNAIMLINSVSKVKFFNITFINGNSPDFGGAIHSELGGQIYVDSCNFINNSARQNGGAIDIAGEQHRIKWQVFTNMGFLNATNCNFINNKAGHDGGALATYWGNSYVYNSYFSQNYADRDGGSIRVGVYSTTLTENCTFDNNTAKEWGGALYNWPGQLTVNNCTITNNYAGEQGGALITSGGLKVTNSVIANNTGVKRGGALYISEETPHIPSTVIFENNVIYGNVAKKGSLVFTDETTATDSNFDNNYWDVDPNSDDWNAAFITKDLIDSPTKFLDEKGNQYIVIPKEPVEDNTPQQEKTDTTENTETTEKTNTTENTETTNQTTETNNTNIVNENTTESNTTNNINEEIIETVEDIVNKVNSEGNSTNIADTNVGLSNEPIQSQQSSPSSADSGSTAHEINKKEVVKQTVQSPLVYIAVILALLIIFGYGYYRHNKNE